MNPLIIVGAVGLGLLVIAGGSSRKSGSTDLGVTGLPTTKRLSYRIQDSSQSQFLHFGPAIALLDGKPVSSSDSVERHRAVSREFHSAMKVRHSVLPANANRYHTDNYSKELYAGPAWLLMLSPESLTKTQYTSAINGVPFDEFGRLKPGKYGSANNSLWGQTLGGLMKNPLFVAVVTVAVLAAPGGIAVYGAYTLWQMKGRDLTVQNVALGAARSYVVAQCGPGCGVAFDMGVGVVSGQPVDKAAEQALVKQMSPTEKKAYDEGKKLYREMT